MRIFGDIMSTQRSKPTGKPSFRNSIGDMPFYLAMGDMPFYNANGGMPFSNYSYADGLFGPCGMKPLWNKEKIDAYNACKERQFSLQEKQMESESKIVDAISAATPSGNNTMKIVGIAAAILVVTGITIFAIKKLRKK